MTRFLCVLLLVGLVAGPLESTQSRDDGGPAQSGHVRDNGVTSPPVVFDAAAVPPAIRGVATWYDAPSPQDAAAGPSLRKALGRHWRGSTVKVCADECVTVRLTDWCACGSRHGTPTVIDLDDVAFSRIAKLSAGVVRVRVTVLGQIDAPLTRPAPTAPPTDVE